MTCTSVRSLSCPGSDYISYIIAFLFHLPMLSYLDRILSTTVELATPEFEPVYEDYADIIGKAFDYAVLHQAGERIINLSFDD